MWKKLLAFSSLFALIIMLDPTHTPAQPGGKFRSRDGGNGFPGGPGGPDTFIAQPGGMPPGGPGGPGGFGPGGPGRRGSDPERGWQMLLRMTNSTGDTVDLSKIPPQTQAMLKGWTERSGGIPLPESGIMTKDAYLDHHAKSEAAKAAFAANGGGNGPGGPGRNMGPGGSPVTFTMDPNGFGRGRGPGGWGGPGGPGGWGDPNGGGWGPGGQGDWQGNMENRPPFEKKQVEEERPVAMRYGKLPQGLPSWFDELDTDKDGQVSLYEWRKAGKETKEFIEMDLNGDSLITADEYLRFMRLKTIDIKKEAYENGERGPGDWGLGEKLDKNDVKADNGKGPRRGPGGPGGGFGPPGSGGWGNKGGGKGERKGNPWGPK